MKAGGLQLKGDPKKYLLLSQDKVLPVRPGSRFDVKMEMSGTGTFGFVVELRDASGKVIADKMLYARPEGKTVRIDDSIRVLAEYKGKAPVSATFGPYIFPRSEGTIAKLDVDFQMSAPNPTLTPVARSNWASAYTNLTKQAKTLKNPPVMFLGDSITHAWTWQAKGNSTGGREVWEKYFAPMGAVNFGISGDRIENVLWRITEGDQLCCHPKVIVLLIGTNNLPRALPSEIAEGMDHLLTVIRRQSPQSKLIVLSIFPRKGDHPVARTNALLAEVFKKHPVTAIDLTDKLLMGKKEVPGEIFCDGLHLTLKGYQCLADALVPEIQKLLERK